jgi:hypothetical protein
MMVYLIGFPDQVNKQILCVLSALYSENKLNKKENGGCGGCPPVPKNINK